MKRGHTRQAGALLLCCALMKCGCAPASGAADASAADAAAHPDAGAGADAAQADAAARDAGLVDTAAPDTLVQDAASADASAPNFGFDIRLPQQRAVDIGGFTAQVWDADRVCTLVYQALDGHSYVQLTPTTTAAGKNQHYLVDGAWVSAGGQVTPVEANYYPGNHWATSMDLVYDGKRFRYYHSSFLDIYGTPCHDYDCLQVHDLASGTLLEDGCTPERTLPIVCVTVAHDGSVPPLVDTFTPCLP